ncbi:45793_t:CDS:1, partial [Gigaspora margarita]
LIVSKQHLSVVEYFGSKNKPKEAEDIRNSYLEKRCRFCLIQEAKLLLEFLDF